MLEPMSKLCCLTTLTNLPSNTVQWECKGGFLLVKCGTIWKQGEYDPLLPPTWIPMKPGEV